MSSFDIENEDDAGGPWLDQVLRYLFHIDDKTPLPKHPEIRSYHVLGLFAKERVERLGRNRLEGKDLHFGKRDGLNFYTLKEDDRTLECCFLKGQATKLPEVAGPDTTWELTDIYDPNCQAKCLQDESVSFLCSSFFGGARSVDLQTGRWDYDVTLPGSEALDVPVPSAGSMGFPLSRP